MLLRNLRAARRVRELGIVSGQNGIYNRYLREKEGWDKHLANTKKLILDAVNQNQPKSICFLGSGYLLDVPADELLENGLRLTFVDISHPTPILKKYSRNPNVSFITEDLTGSVLQNLSSERLRDIIFFKLANLIERAEPFTPDADFVVSLNLLSQLSDIPLEFLRRKGKLTDWQSIELATAIQQKHINSLPKGKSLLVSDIMEEYYNDKGELMATRPTVFADLSGLSQVKEWIWEFDTEKTYLEDAVTKLRVVAGLL